jgi:dsDNA-specific endonuclease/ATPase MutS2
MTIFNMGEISFALSSTSRNPAPGSTTSNGLDDKYTREGSIMNINCPECGIKMTELSPGKCPKCDFDFRDYYKNTLHEADVAHGGEDWFQAEDKIHAAVNHAILHHYKGVKIIHGHGRHRGHHGIIRQNALSLLKTLASQHHGKMVPDKGNPGAHILYFN